MLADLRAIAGRGDIRVNDQRAAFHESASQVEARHRVPCRRRDEERKNAEQNLKAAYERIQDHINSIKDMAWKQSHLIRSPLANLKGLSAILKDDPSDGEVLAHIQNELDRMDTIIIEMAADASADDVIK